MRKVQAVQMQVLQRPAQVQPQPLHLAQHLPQQLPKQALVWPLARVHCHRQLGCLPIICSRRAQAQQLQQSVVQSQLAPQEPQLLLVLVLCPVRAVVQDQYQAIVLEQYQAIQGRQYWYLWLYQAVPSPRHSPSTPLPPAASGPGAAWSSQQGGHLAPLASCQSLVPCLPLNSSPCRSVSRGHQTQPAPHRWRQLLRDHTAH
jgi:hypothetical protein